MNIDQLPYEKHCYSINDKNDIVWQPTQEIHKHKVEKGYLILSKNDFGKVKKRVNLGYFNKKTNYMVGEKNSLMIWDSQTKEIITCNISELLLEPKRYFLFYDLNFVFDKSENNETLNLTRKKTNEHLTIKLTNQFGKDIGEFLRRSNTNTTIPDHFNILNSIISLKDNKLSLNKQVLVNSNQDFLIGILEGYIQENRFFTLKNNVNIYNFTYILNLLGAQYSIRSLINGEKQIRFRLPTFFKTNSSLKDNFFRQWKYYFDEDLNLKLERYSSKVSTDDTSVFALANTGLIEMIPIKDLVFVEVQDEIMYDMTMTRSDATNYCMPGGFYSKNSDGDILGVIALLSEDGSREAIQKFSTELKENFLNLSTGDTSNWGVKLDSQVGLYSATK
jgi:hypothetical protein